MKNIETLEKLCEIVEKQIDKAVDALMRDNGKLPAADADYLDKLTHTLKSIKTTMAMEGYGSSERRGRDSMGRFTSRADGSYYDGGSYDGYGRSRWSYDVGPYSERSMHGDAKEELQRMSNETGDERVKRALEDAMRKM